MCWISQTKYFNPRPREGSDLINTGTYTNMLISIHAPAKGATHFPDGGTKYQKISIHAPAKGATCPFNFSSLWVFISIHAPAKGATLLPYNSYLPCGYFNPRPREGSDRNRAPTPSSFRISIHAPAKGATKTQ